MISSGGSYKQKKNRPASQFRFFYLSARLKASEGVWVMKKYGWLSDLPINKKTDPIGAGFCFACGECEIRTHGTLTRSRFSKPLL